MIQIRIEEHTAFPVIGRKTWIPGQDNEVFASFWKLSNENGLIERLKHMAEQKSNTVTNSDVLGVSCVEKDPNNRAFFFYIAAEAPDQISPSESDLERYLVPACQWAIFSNEGALPLSLVEAEMYAFMEWLPASKYAHASAPELEVYPAKNKNAVEFWLPIVNKHA